MELIGHQSYFDVEKHGGSSLGELPIEDPGDAVGLGE